jgi:hypothetical protein
MRGFGEDDSIDGLGGEDELLGGDGDDFLDANDGEGDRLSCRAGADDAAELDLRDRSALAPLQPASGTLEPGIADCERLDRRPVGEARIVRVGLTLARSTARVRLSCAAVACRGRFVLEAHSALQVLDL